jgi:hypothetical protein
MMTPLERLSRDDEVNLALEAPDTPMHQAGLGILRRRPAAGCDGHPAHRR